MDREMVYDVRINVARIEDTHIQGDPWSRWCNHIDRNGLPIRIDPRISFGGADANNVEHWTITTRRPWVARAIVERYARAVGVDVDVISIERL